MSEKKLLPKVNIEIDRLPSQGKSYPEDFTANYRSYSFGEIKHASTSRLNDKQALELVLKGVHSNMNKNLFTMNDAFFIGILRKLASLGTSKAQVPFEDELVKEPQYYTFGLEDIEFRDMDAPKLPLTVTLSNGEEYTFGPILVKDYLKLVRLKKNNDSVALYAVMCKSHSFEETYKFFNETQVREDGEILEEVERLLDHGIKPFIVNYQIELESGEKIERTKKLQLERRSALLLPFRKDGKPIRDKICFGDASKP